LLLTVSEPLLKASQHEFKAFRKWILNLQEEPETPLPTHPIAKALIQKFFHLLPERYSRVYMLKEISNTTLVSFLVLSLLTSEVIDES